MKIYARQGDLVIHKLATPPEATYEKKQDHILAGSNGSEHRVIGSARVATVSEFESLVQVAEATELRHGSRHKSVPLEPGAYRITHIRERGNQVDLKVQD